jgi:hypothetical protein
MFFFLVLASWFGWCGLWSFRFYEFAHSSKVVDPASGRVVLDTDKGTNFFVRPWEYAVFHWGLPAMFAALVVGMGISWLFFREDYKRQMRHPLTIIALLVAIAGAIAVVHTFSGHK